MITPISSVTVLILALSINFLTAKDSSYDPLKTLEDAIIETHDFVVKDKKRNREIPVKVYLPNSDSSSPVVLFSHGLGGSKDNNPYLGNHWAKRGYLAVFMQHAGSDESVWKGVKPREMMNALKKAASAENAKLRYEDVPALIDSLESWNSKKDHPLYQKLDLSIIGMSGHSFGAITTQAVSGQQAIGGLINYTEDRIKAAVAFSPSSPQIGKPERAFGKVKIPWMLMTGTKDISPVGNADLDSRLSVFPALPKGDKYELVLDGAEHSAFSERALSGDKQTRNPNHHKTILALSTAFWDAYLRKDKDAKAWLKSDQVRDVLEEEDRWQKK
ncbi:MAG: dienelactone hydrolase [Verrucomicrobia bacterium]|nr:dienelactone hydrolase [Verrucomicrobiota bacterium]MDA1065022.1 dienelactone hydrolase [Verrucomicrobiota bacterium]